MPKKIKGGKVGAKDLEEVIKETYSKNPKNDIGDYILDKDLSTDEQKVYYNPKTGQTLVSHRGTESTLKDWSNNLQYAVGNYENTDRYKRGEKVQKAAEKKYGKENISTIGHSQGAVLSRKLGKDTKEVINVNPAYKGEKQAKNEYNVRSSNDVVSALVAPVNKVKDAASSAYNYLFKPKDKKKKSTENNITIKAETHNPLTEHKPDILERLPEGTEIGAGMSGGGINDLFEGIKLKVLRIAVANYFNKYSKNKEEYKDWFVMTKPNLIKIIIENKIEKLILEEVKILHLTKKNSINTIPTKILKIALNNILHPKLKKMGDWMNFTRKKLETFISILEIEEQILEIIGALEIIYPDYFKKRKYVKKINKKVEQPKINKVEQPKINKKVEQPKINKVEQPKINKVEQPKINKVIKKIINQYIPDLQDKPDLLKEIEEVILDNIDDIAEDIAPPKKIEQEVIKSNKKIKIKIDKKKPEKYKDQGLFGIIKDNIPDLEHHFIEEIEEVLIDNFDYIEEALEEKPKKKIKIIKKTEIVKPLIKKKIKHLFQKQAINHPVEQSLSDKKMLKSFSAKLDEPEEQDEQDEIFIEPLEESFPEGIINKKINKYSKAPYFEPLEESFPEDIIEKKINKYSKIQPDTKQYLKQIKKEIDYQIKYFNHFANEHKKKILTKYEKNSFLKQLDIIKIRVGGIIQEAIEQAGQGKNKDNEVLIYEDVYEPIVKAIMKEYLDYIKLYQPDIDRLLGSKDETEEEKKEEMILEYKNQIERIVKKIDQTINKSKYIYNSKKKKSLNDKEKRFFIKDILELKDEVERIAKTIGEDVGDGYEKILLKIFRDYDSTIYSFNEIIKLMLGKVESEDFFKKVFINDPQEDKSKMQIIKELNDLYDEYIESMKFFVLSDKEVGAPSISGLDELRPNAIKNRYTKLMSTGILRGIEFIRILPTEEELRKKLKMPKIWKGTNKKQ
jgi:hypothetical protein